MLAAADPIEAAFCLRDSMTCMTRVGAGGNVVWLEFSERRETADDMILDTRFFSGTAEPEHRFQIDWSSRMQTKISGRLKIQPDCGENGGHDTSAPGFHFRVRGTD
jgi:hypothetical protein